MASKVTGEELKSLLWTRYNEAYVTEASTIGFGRYPTFTCPKCQGLVNLTEQKFNTVHEFGEIVKVEGVHNCGAKLEIFND